MSAISGALPRQASFAALVVVALSANVASAGFLDGSVSQLFDFFGARAGENKEQGCAQLCSRQGGSCIEGKCICKEGFFGPSCSQAVAETPKLAIQQSANKEFILQAALRRARQSTEAVKPEEDPLTGSASSMTMMEVTAKRAKKVAEAVRVRSSALPTQPEPPPISASAAAKEELFDAMKSSRTALAAAAATRSSERMKSAAKADETILKDSPLRNARDLMDKITRYLRPTPSPFPPGPVTRCTENCDKTKPQGPAGSALLNGVPPLEPGKCRDDCNGHGQCSGGECLCSDGWFGDSCDIKGCPEDCNGRGSCLQGICACDSAFFGAACENRRCPKDCSKNGYCENGACHCYHGFQGDSCDKRVLMAPPAATANRMLDRAPLPDRTGLGSIVDEARKIAPPSCPEDCNERGRCEVDGTCSCIANYTGLACENHCPNSCSGRGECSGGMCVCDFGYGGVDCSQQLCCNGHGACPIPDVCHCYPGFIGAQCETEMQCPDPTCSGQGTCYLGVCRCAAGWEGVACQQKVAPKLPPGVSGAGMYLPPMGGLDYVSPYEAASARAALGVAPAPAPAPGIPTVGLLRSESGTAATSETIKIYSPKAPSCNEPHGRWSDEFSACVCQAPYHGERCEQKHCPDWDGQADGVECSGKGMCYLGVCYCLTGYGIAPNSNSSSNICADLVCPADCGEHGICQEGQCMCETGWQGNTCREPQCENDCNGHGKCLFPAPDKPGRCVCDDGFQGPDCVSVAFLDVGGPPAPAVPAASLSETTQSLQVQGAPRILAHREVAPILLQRRHRRHRETSAVRLNL
mmetsp:Transcript_22644/g.40936  ORF Transcript_22644/g.40936 Transcript_22644/m.40936 type:complete len:808 (+) Transcript_22644:85-2508(+)